MAAAVSRDGSGGGLSGSVCSFHGGDHGATASGSLVTIDKGIMVLMQSFAALGASPGKG